MEKMKKVEIIAAQRQIEKLLPMVNDLGIPGYTVLPVLAGKGPHGFRDDEGLTGALSNHQLVVVCTEDQVKKLLEKIKPSLKKRGGICLVSDTQIVNL